MRQWSSSQTCDTHTKWTDRRGQCVQVSPQLLCVHVPSGNAVIKAGWNKPNKDTSYSCWKEKLCTECQYQTLYPLYFVPFSAMLVTVSVRLTSPVHWLKHSNESLEITQAKPMLYYNRIAYDVEHMEGTQFDISYSRAGIENCIFARQKGIYGWTGVAYDDHSKGMHFWRQVSTTPHFRYKHKLLMGINKKYRNNFIWRVQNNAL